MNNTMYDEYKPIVSFYKVNDYIYYKHNNDFIILKFDTIENLKKEIIFPCKMSFYDIPMDKICNIIDNFIDDDLKVLCYRVKEDNSTIYDVVFIKNEIIKKLK